MAIEISDEVRAVIQRVLELICPLGPFDLGVGGIDPARDIENAERSSGSRDTPVDDRMCHGFGAHS